MVLFLVFLAFGAILVRGFWLAAVDNQRLIDEADLRHVRIVEVSDKRGDLLDRHGVLLAKSLPVYSVVADPKQVLLTANFEQMALLAEALETTTARLLDRLQPRKHQRFYYLQHALKPSQAEVIRELNLAGITLEKRFKRYYPEGEIASHLIGFTDLDDQGQEGLERLFNDFLTGQTGQQKVVKDRFGVVMREVEWIKQPRPGLDIRLSIDSRLQYVAYRALKNAVHKHQADSGSVVVLDGQTGEILAMVAQPHFNPNDRSQLRSEWVRNRTALDIFEPGSTIKPFTLAAALELGIVEKDSLVDARPGYLEVGGRRIYDARNFGALSLEGIIQHSSNVASAQLALQMGPESLWRQFKRMGLDDYSGYPGETLGNMRYFTQWGLQGLATHAYGYGFSLNLLQLARAYTLFVNQGEIAPLSILPLEPEQVQRQSVVQPQVAQAVLQMMQAVPRVGGTAPLASVKGFSVAGKTGTTHKNTVGGYSDDKYRASFVGVAPASRPQFVVLVMIDEPRRGSYFGGQVAGPVFSEVMSEALRLYQVPPDHPEALQ